MQGEFRVPVLVFDRFDIVPAHAIRTAERFDQCLFRGESCGKRVHRQGAFAHSEQALDQPRCARHGAIEPRIPGIFQYYSVAEDELAKIFAGKTDAQTGADNIAAAWEKLTDQIGRAKQIELYKASLA